MVTVDETDPLKNLIDSAEKSVDHKRLAAFLEPFVSIDGGTQQLSFLPKFDGLVANAEKIEVALIASKARSMLFGEPDGLTQGEIIALDIMPEGSVKATLKRLYDSKKVKKDKELRYFVPGYRINEVLKKDLDGRS